MQGVKKAVIPAAGLGTRLLPASKSVPKELLPVVDRPSIDYVVREAVNSGVEHVIFITSMGKEAIEDYFDRDPSLERNLEKKEKYDLLDCVKEVSDLIEVSTVRQKKPLGLGHAVLQARNLTGDAPFAVLLPDDLFVSDTPCIKQLIECCENQNKSVVGLMEVPEERVHRYGIVDGVEVSENTFRLEDMIEKPSPEKAPSRLAIPGRYVLTPEIFDVLRDQEPGVGGEIQLTDALKNFLDEDDIYGKVIDGTRYDVGNKLGFLKANLVFALRREEYNTRLREFIEENVRI